LNSLTNPLAIALLAIAAIVLAVVWGVFFDKTGQTPAFAPGSAGNPLRPAPSGAGLLVKIAVVLNLLTWPAALALVDAAPPQAGPGIWLVWLFPLLGVVMFAVALLIYLTRYRAGSPLLVLDGVNPLKGRLHFEPALGMRLLPSRPMHAISIDVLLVEDAGTGDDDTETILWQETAFNGELARGTAFADFYMQAPQPETANVGLQVKLNTAGTSVVFKLPRQVMFLNSA
jgi:hypothetical protein